VRCFCFVVCCFCIGDKLHSATSFQLVVDRVVTSSVETPLIAVALLFGAFFTFNIEYPAETAATLEFIQRFVHFSNILSFKCFFSVSFLCPLTLCLSLYFALAKVYFRLLLTLNVLLIIKQVSKCGQIQIMI